MVEGFDFFDEATGLEILHDLFASLETVQAGVRAAVLVNGRVRIEDVDLLQAMTPPDFKVVDVVRGCDLECTRAELAVDVAIRDDGNPALQKWQNDIAAGSVTITFVIGMNGNSRVAQHSLRACRGDGECSGSISVRIADVVKRAALI